MTAGVLDLRRPEDRAAALNQIGITENATSEEDRFLLYELEFPLALIAAIRKEGRYALQMANGNFLHFTRASYAIGSKWVRATVDRGRNSGFGVSLFAELGITMIDVRLSEIAWVSYDPGSEPSRKTW